MTDVDTSFHLRNNYAPVTVETTETQLRVTGTIPPELNGTYMRNGPNPKNGDSGHWFIGDGMLHGVRLREGRADWYRNRWVQTRKLNEPDAEMIGPDGNVDYTIGASNTHIVRHAGKTLALVESSFPCEVDANLDTIGVHDFDGKLTTAMTAHPKMCPLTGEMHFFGYGFFAPYLTYHVVDAAGQLIRSVEIEVPGPTMIHDFSITENHVVFMDLPVVFDLDRAMQGTMPYRWDDDYGARLGVMPRDGTNADVRWVEIDPCYVFHPLNSFDDGDSIVLDAARYPELWRADAADFKVSANLHRWRIKADGSGVTEEQLDDAGVEFPRVNDHRVGLPNRFGWCAGDAVTGSGAVVAYDLENGTSQFHDFGEHRSSGEPVMVSAGPDAAEDHGWVLSFVHDKATDTSDLVILNAADVAADPVATIHLPVRVPVGFHGSWFADE